MKAWLLEFLHWVSSLGPAGMAVFGVTYVAATVLFLSGTVLALASGFLFGLVPGTLLISAASVTGATLSFLIARGFGRQWALRRLADYPKMDLLDRAMECNGFRLVLLMRLQPMFLPFAVLNYALGLTRVRLRDYALASWLGMLPATTLYVYAGTSLHSLAELLQGSHSGAGPWRQALFWGGLAVTAMLLTMLTRFARQVLARESGESQ